MVYIYTPQSYHVHNHTWTEYPDEPCSPHCMIPTRTDKSFAKFYLSNSLCQKHNSSLTGPWIYLSNRFSTLPKLYKCPEICHFITLLNQKVRANHEIRNSLIACQLVENQHVFTLIIRVIGWVLQAPAYAVGVWVIIYYRQVLLPLGIAWLCERWYRILLIGCLHLSLRCDTWFTS